MGISEHKGNVENTRCRQVISTFLQCFEKRIYESLIYMASPFALVLILHDEKQ